MEDKIKELEKIIIKLKQENLYLQKQLNLNDEDIIVDLKNLKKELKKIKINDDTKGGYIFKNQDNIDKNDTFFIDLLIEFYEEIIELVNLGREYNEKGDNKNLEYILYKILDTYQDNQYNFRFYICDKRLDYMDKIVSICQNSDMSDIDKIEYFYNKIYYEIFIEFFGNYSFSA